MFFASWSVLVKFKKKQKFRVANFFCALNKFQRISSLVQVLYCTHLPPLTHHTHSHITRISSGYTHMPSPPDIEQQMAEVLRRISDTLDTHSPPNGGIDAKKLLASPAQSPAVSRRFFFDPLSRERRSCVEPIIRDRCSCIEPITAEVHLNLPRSSLSLGEIGSAIASQRYPLHKTIMRDLAYGV